MNRRDQKGRLYRETDRRKTSQKPAWARTERAAAERSACGGRSAQRRGRAGPRRGLQEVAGGPGPQWACQPHAVEGFTPHSGAQQPDRRGPCVPPSPSGEGEARPGPATRPAQAPLPTPALSGPGLGDEAALPSWHSACLSGRCWALCPIVSPHSAPGSDVQTQDWGGLATISKMPFPPSTPMLQNSGTKTQRGPAACLGGTARPGHIETQTPHPGTCPLWHSPTSAQEGWRMVGGPGARRQRLGWEAGWPLAPPPPRAPQPGSVHPAAQLPAHPPRPRHQSTPGPLLPLSFLPSSSLPNSSLFFFFSPLSLPTCHYSRNKKRGDNAGIDGSPLPPRCVPALFPPAQGWNRCQRSRANKQEEPDKPGTQ